MVFDAESIVNLLKAWGLKIVIMLVVFYVGKWIAGMVRKGAASMFRKRELEPTLARFAESMIYIIAMIVVILTALKAGGIKSMSFVAVLGAAGLAVGLALQGTLSNFASGVLLILFRPIKVGDYIEGGGVSGSVESIQLFATNLTTPDNKAIIVPNSKLTSDNIVNYSAKERRRIDFVFGVSYDADLAKVKEIIGEVLAGEERILPEPAPIVGLLELADSSVNFAVRPWVKTTDYWGVYFNIMETMKQRFDQEGIVIPFPQRDVHIFPETPEA